MTPFMHAVLDRSGSVGPRTQPSHPRTLARATDAQFVVRALAEQLVSEANAVLASKPSCTAATPSRTWAASRAN
jgi:hypothetical protein